MGHESADITFRYAHLFPMYSRTWLTRLITEGTVSDALPQPKQEALFHQGLQMHAGNGRPHRAAGKVHRRDAAGVHHRDSGRKPITINTDIRTYKMLRDDMRKAYQELCRIRPGGHMDERLIAKVELLAELFAGIAVEEPGVLELEDAMFDEMECG